LALLFLITTVTPSVEGLTFRSSPETPFHEYAQSGQKEADNQELGTANAPSTEQILLISSVIVLTIWHLIRAREDVPPVELSSDTHSLSEDEELEHYYSNGALRPAIPHRDTTANPDRERSPLSDDDDLSDDHNTFFGPLRQRKSSMMRTQSTHATAEVSVADEELRPMHEPIPSDGGDTDGWVTDEEVTYSYSVPWCARDPHRHTGPMGIHRSGPVADRAHPSTTTGT
jgi:hypothetical protein